MPRPKAGATKLVRQWLAIAEEDLLLARHAMSTMKSSVPFGLIAYHSQQAAEKAIKAYLVYLDIDFPYTHDLTVLLKLCPEGSGLYERLFGVRALSLYGVKARYPQDRPKVDRKQAMQAVALAELAFVQVKAALQEAAFKG